MKIFIIAFLSLSFSLLHGEDSFIYIENRTPGKDMGILFINNHPFHTIGKSKETPLVKVKLERGRYLVTWKIENTFHKEWLDMYGDMHVRISRTFIRDNWKIYTKAPNKIDKYIAKESETSQDTLLNLKSLKPKKERPANTAELDYIKELKQLKELVEAGILTNEEFETKKKAILKKK
jgi:hypothetical protein